MLTLHSCLKKRIVFCMMVICSQIAVGEKAVVYYGVRRRVIVTHAILVLQWHRALRDKAGSGKGNQ
jgi:hypothetical protein